MLKGSNMTLGGTYVDDATGYEGKLTAKIEYLGGRVSACIERDNGTDKPAEAWFDPERLRFPASA